jgi:phage-related baseplate assembly protein
MKTKSIQTEIFFCLSPTSKIDDAVQQYTVNEATKNIFIVIFEDIDTSAIHALIGGQLIALNEFDNEAITDVEKLERIANAYKVPLTLARDYATIEKIILSKTATKFVL